MEQERTSEAAWAAASGPARSVRLREARDRAALGHIQYVFTPLLPCAEGISSRTLGRVQPLPARPSSPAGQSSASPPSSTLSASAEPAASHQQRNEGGGGGEGRFAVRR